MSDTKPTSASYMSWLSGAWTLIKNIPTLLSIAKAVYDAYLEFERKRKQKQMEDALAKVDQGDQRDLERLLRK
jgi:hypothetical protein